MPPSRKSLGKRPQAPRVADSDDESDIQTPAQSGSQSHSNSASQSRPKQPKFEKIDPEYLNKQVDPTKADTKLRQLIAEAKITKADLAKVIQTLTQSATDLATVGAKNPDEMEFDDDHIPPDEELIAKLDAALRRTIDQLKKVDITASVLSEIKGRINQGIVITDLSGPYESEVKLAMDQWMARTSRQKYMDDRVYVHFRTIIWEAMYEGRPMPNIKKLIPAEAGDEEDDDEIEVGGQQTDFRCPLTLGILEKPMTSSLCPHSFSGDAIRGMLKDHRGRMPCPISGCPKTLTLADLYEDDNLAQRVEQFQRRQKGEGTQGRGRTQTQYQTVESDEDEDD